MSCCLHAMLSCLHALAPAPTTPPLLPPAAPQVREVTSGTECGVSASDFRDWQEGDKIEAFEVVEKKLKLEEAHAATVDFGV